MKDGIDQLIKLIDEVVVKYNGWGIIEQTRGGIGPGFLHSKICLFFKHDKKLSINESFEHYIKIICVKNPEQLHGKLE